MAPKGEDSKEDSPLKEVKWADVTLYLAVICVVDIAVHYQYIPNQEEHEEEGILKRDEPGSHFFQLGIAHSLTAKVLCCSSVFRTGLLFLSFRICEQKCIPKFIQPYIHHITMTAAFVFCSITMWRFLLDSEPPKSIHYFGYLFLILADVIFTLAEYALNRYVLKHSGAVTDVSENEDAKMSKKKKEEEKKERTVPFLVMLKKLSFWYTSEWLAITGAYTLMMIGTLGKTTCLLISEFIIKIKIWSKR